MRSRTAYAAWRRTGLLDQTAGQTTRPKIARPKMPRLIRLIRPRLAKRPVKTLYENRQLAILVSRPGCRFLREWPPGAGDRQRAVRGYSDQCDKRPSGARRPRVITLHLVMRLMQNPVADLSMGRAPARTDPAGSADRCLRMHAAEHHQGRITFVSEPVTGNRHDMAKLKGSPLHGLSPTAEDLQVIIPRRDRASLLQGEFG